MKILILGAGGMLGHLTACYLKEKYGSRVVLAARKPTGNSFLDQNLEVIDLGDLQHLQSFLLTHRPCIVVNCAAVNDPAAGKDLLQSINTRLPREIATILDSVNDSSRLVHISTDGVFSGEKGGYSENDMPDAQDPYGRSKYEGEITKPTHLTVRTSIIGPDPFLSRGLMNWLLSQNGEVKGFARVFWSGVTTLELTKFIDTAIHRNYSGLYHLVSRKISKCDLLEVISKVFQKHITIRPQDVPVLDRTLVSSRNDIQYQVPEISAMIGELKTWMMNHPKIYHIKGF